MTLEIAEQPSLNRPISRAAIYVVPGAEVHLTWPAIASLWALCSGAVRIFSETERFRKSASVPHPYNAPMVLNVEKGSPLADGIALLEISSQILELGPADQRQVLWRYAPVPHPEPNPGSLDETGNKFFLRALSWVLHHELAHVRLGHLDSEGFVVERIRQEYEADAEATRVLKGQSATDPNRALSTTPNVGEMKVEILAIAAMLALTWTAIVETSVGQTSSEHPPVGDRMDRLTRILDLRSDSLAFQLLADLVKTWWGAEERWAEGPFADPAEAFSESLYRLHRLMSRHQS